MKRKLPPTLDAASAWMRKAELHNAAVLELALARADLGRTDGMPWTTKWCNFEKAVDKACLRYGELMGAYQTFTACVEAGENDTSAPVTVAENKNAPEVILARSGLSTITESRPKCD